ncbi:DUF1343 domain-containing protein [bacterium]|nr:DUF1343 domain-containing protein [bacterium]
MKQKIKTGIDVLRDEAFARLEGASLAVVTNHAAVDSNYRHLIDLLSESAFVKSGSIKIKALFGPEHGLFGGHQDMQAVGNASHAKLKIPIYSLYGSSFESLMPTKEQLAGIDTLVFDLVDIGTRYYTFAQTLYFCMQRAAELKIRVVVLDRPNPIGGSQIEGSPLTTACRSFCGIHPIANRHGLTLGELAKLFQAGFSLAGASCEPVAVDLEIVNVLGWKREQYLDQTTAPWVFPSPNMPTVDTAVVYPGACLFEATNISEGRGTTKPFELIGAPFIDSGKWIDAIAQTGSIQGCILRPAIFIPKFHKFSGLNCYGVEIHVTDRSTFKPYRLGLAMIHAAKKCFASDFSWRTDAYEFVKEVPAIDLLFGSSAFREIVDSGKASAQWLEIINNFEATYIKATNQLKTY